MSPWDSRRDGPRGRDAKPRHKGALMSPDEARRLRLVREQERQDRGREKRGQGEAFFWGLGLCLLGILIVAILRYDFSDDGRPLTMANFGAAISLIFWTVVWSAITSSPVL